MLQLLYFSWLGRSCDRLPGLGFDLSQRVVALLQESLLSLTGPLMHRSIVVFSSKSKWVSANWMENGSKKASCAPLGCSLYLAACCNHGSGIAMQEYCNLQHSGRYIFRHKIWWICIWSGIRVLITTGDSWQSRPFLMWEDFKGIVQLKKKKKTNICLADVETLFCIKWN